MLDPTVVRAADSARRPRLSRAASPESPRPAPDAFACAVAGMLTRTRERARLTQGQVAQRVGVNRSAVSRWETAQRTPTLDHFRRFGELVGRPASTLLAEVEAALDGAGDTGPSGWSASARSPARPPWARPDPPADAPPDHADDHADDGDTPARGPGAGMGRKDDDAAAD